MEEVLKQSSSLDDCNGDEEKLKAKREKAKIRKRLSRQRKRERIKYLLYYSQL